MPIVDNLFIKLGYDYDPKKLDKFNETAQKTGKILKLGSLAAIGLATSFTLLFSKMSANALAQKRFGDSVGVSRDNIAAFARTSEELTGSRGAAAGIISQFKDVQNALAAGIAPSENFLRVMQMTGVTMTDLSRLNPGDLLLRFSASFQTLSENSKNAIVSLLGLNEAGENLFNKITPDLLRKNLPSNADLAAIEKFDKLLKDLKQSFNDAIVAFGTPIFQQLIPVIDKLTEKMPVIVGFAGDVTSAFIGMGAAISNGFNIASDAIDSFISDNTRLFNAIGNGFSTAVDVVGSAAFTAGDFLGLTGTSNNQSTSNNTVNQYFDVNVVSDNAQAVADQIQRIGQEQMSQANKNLINPVKN